jgi:AraC family transcriptional regulator of adaptative response / DNA-3-methyladenine glycosylase II
MAESRQTRPLRQCEGRYVPLPLIQESELDADACYAAIQSRDPRFDGQFVTAVRSTGIYCRPSCPALVPRRSNVGFVRTAAAAQRAGYRACKRCRPDAAPGTNQWDLAADTAGRAMRLVEDGVVDREGVDGLAARLGFSTRQLRRHLVTELGAGPLTLARAQRARTARLLLESTDLPAGDIAFAAGFGSVRQCNDTIRTIYDATPGDLRRAMRIRRTDRTTPGDSPFATLDLRLPYRSAADIGAVLRFHGRHAVEGIESYDGVTYARSMRLPHGVGVVACHLDDRDGVRTRIHVTEIRDLAVAVSRCRRLLALDADPAAVDAHLVGDPALGPLVTRFPGRVVPGTHDGMETAIRTVLGQQVSVAAARRTTAKLVALAGSPLPAMVEGVFHVFPDADTIAALDPAELPVPQARARTVTELAGLFTRGFRLDPGVERNGAEAALLAVPGIGRWTARYLRMRALNDPDVLLGDDLIVRRAATALGLPTTPADLAELSRAWSPWNSTVTFLLWASAIEAPAGAGNQRSTDPEELA